MSKIIETLEKNEVLYKDLGPPGPRRAVIYLGDKNFQTDFNKMVNLQNKKLKEIRHI